MTISQFDQMGWTYGMRATYCGKVYPISTVDFVERLIGLLGTIENEPEAITMVRCENVDLFP